MASGGCRSPKAGEEMSLTNENDASCSLRVMLDDNSENCM